MQAFRQTAAAKLDYTIDVTQWLVPGDGVQSASWAQTTGAGITISNQTTSLTTASAYLTGGTVTPADDPNNGNIITVTIITVLGRTFPVNFTLIIDPYEV